MTNDIKALWKHYRATKDPAAKEALVRKYIYLVRYVAGRLALRLPAHLEMDDLTSSGIMGFLAAVEAFDPDREVDFPTYALARIRGAILDELRSLDWVPRFVRKKTRLLEKAFADLEQGLNRPPTDEEMARHLKVELREYHQLLQDTNLHSVISMDDGWEDGGKEEGHLPQQFLRDQKEPDPLTVLAVDERKRILGRIINSLAEQERRVLSLYYYEELTMKEIGQVLGISESRVSQVHASALLRVRARLRRWRIDPSDLVAERPAHPIPAGNVPSVQ